MTKLNAMRGFFCLAVLFVFACQPPKDKKMLLTLRLSEGDAPKESLGPLTEEAAPGAQFHISNSNIPDQSFEFAEGQTEHTFEISLDAPEIISMTYDESFQKNLYAEPGGKLTITLRKEDANKDKFTYTSEGSGAVYMELLDSLAKLEVAFREHHQDKQYGQYSLDWEDFDKELNAVQQHKKTLMAHAKGLSDEFKAFIKADFFASRMIHLQTYERLFNHRKEEGTADFVIPEAKDAYEKAFAFGEVAMKSHNFKYFINHYIYDEGMKILDESDHQSPKKSAEKVCAWLKSNEKIPETFKPYMLGSYVIDITMYLGIEEALQFKEDFLKNYPDAASAKAVKAHYAKLEALKRGNPAPDFEYESLEGEMVSLSSLKGNVVYIDVWATWCGPCIKEFPNSRTLKEKFKDAEDVKWVYVSIDDANAREKWKKAVAKHKLKGIHLFSGGGWNATIAKLYQIMAIPRYILVDKAGNIYNSNASRPSSEEIYNEIQKLRGEEG